jgi:ATP-dependent RNA helicase DeaD
MRVLVAPIYGGASYAKQLQRLDQGAQIVVGTPGRLIDLIDRGALKLGDVRYLVLDEADEMLKMGFIDDVERILSETPETRQTALFSATMPEAIRRLAQRYLKQPETVAIETRTRTVDQVEQRYYLVYEESKLAALSRLLEVEDISRALIFARTKIRTGEIAEALNARGFHAEALNGDLNQEVRETVLRRFRNGQVTFLVATDVVARGVDIPTVSHVINFDIPQDSEDYVHRIGRTGRAGREGVAITLVTPRERYWLRIVEQYTRQSITRTALPTADDIRAHRNAAFAAALRDQLENATFDDELTTLDTLAREGYDVRELAAAAMRLARSGELDRPIEDVRDLFDRGDAPRQREFGGRNNGGPRPPRREEVGMVRLVMDVGHEHGIRPGDIVGAIAGETGIPGKAIGAIDIQKSRTFVDVKEAHADLVLRQMGKGYLRGRPINLTRAVGSAAPGPRRSRTFEPA